MADSNPKGKFRIEITERVSQGRQEQQPGQGGGRRQHSENETIAGVATVTLVIMAAIIAAKMLGVF